MTKCKYGPSGWNTLHDLSGLEADAYTAATAEECHEVLRRLQAELIAHYASPRHRPCPSGLKERVKYAWAAISGRPLPAQPRPKQRDSWSHYDHLAIVGLLTTRIARATRSDEYRAAIQAAEAQSSAYRQGLKNSRGKKPGPDHLVPETEPPSPVESVVLTTTCSGCKNPLQYRVIKGYEKRVARVRCRGCKHLGRYLGRL